MLGEGAFDVGEGGALLLGAPVAEAGAEADFGVFGGAGDEVDDAGGCVGTVQRRPGAFENFDLGEGIERDGDVHVEIGRLHAVEAHAVPEDEGLAEGAAADGEATLDGAGGTFAEVEGGVEVEEVGDGGGEGGEFARGNGADGAFGLFEGDGVIGPGDDYGLLRLWLVLLGRLFLAPHTGGDGQGRE